MVLLPSGNTRRIYLIIAIIIIVGLWYQITRQEVLVQPNHQPLDVLHKQPQTPGDPTTDPVLAQANSELARAKKALNASVQPQAKNESIIGQSAAVPDAWSIGNTTTTTSIPIPEGVSVYEPVSIDMDNPDYPEPGEQISVTMPGGEQLTVNVEGSTTNPNGDYTWRGHLDGHGGDEYPVVMTYGGNSAFATVTTPKGSYTLESVNGNGWIYKNPSEFELSHPGANDYLEIPHEHQ
jgi:hypothetical protein